MKGDKVNMKCHFKIIASIIAFLNLLVLLFVPISPIRADTVSDKGTSNEYNGIGEIIAERALRAVGQGYSLTDRYGPTYYDCSGLVYTILKEVGHDLYGTEDMTGVPTYPGAWTSLINSKKVGDVLSFNGIKYKLTAKNITIYNSEYFEKPGTIMIFDGHAAISLGTFDYQGTWYDTVDYVAKYLIAEYGDTVTDLKTELVRDAKKGFYGQDCIFINGNWQNNYNKVWKVDALNTTWGVAVNNTHYGKSTSSTNILGVWEPVDESKTVSLTLVKSIKANDIVWGNGNPTFIFKVSGTDIQGNIHTYYKVVEFKKSYVDSHTDPFGYTSISVTFSNMIAGTYMGSEDVTARYQLEGISSVINGTIQGESVKFDLVNHSSGSAVFTNIKYEWGGNSHTSYVVNEIK